MEIDGGGAVKCEKQLRTMKPRWERRKRCAAVTTRVIHSNPATNSRGMPPENIECEALLDVTGREGGITGTVVVVAAAVALAVEEEEEEGGGEGVDMLGEEGIGTENRVLLPGRTKSALGYESLCSRPEVVKCCAVRRVLGAMCEGKGAWEERVMIMKVMKITYGC